MGLVEREEPLLLELAEEWGKSSAARVDNKSILVIKATLMAHGLIQVAHANGYDWWQLTHRGSEVLILLNAARTKKTSPPAGDPSKS
jgi:predicted DsbA family dithiol-disulfide isomerase